jgi:hypothetical protein
MRTNIKTNEYFTNYIDTDLKRIEKLNNWIDIRKVVPERIPSTKRKIFRTSLHILIAKYSSGAAPADLAGDFLRPIKMFEQGALVKILGLNDSILKDQQYYPYDMVHWRD